jgi:hypothetical protein
MRAEIHFVHTADVIYVIEWRANVLVVSHQEHVDHLGGTPDRMRDFPARKMRSGMGAHFDSIPQCVKSDILLDEFWEILCVSQLSSTCKQLVAVQR